MIDLLKIVFLDIAVARTRMNVCITLPNSLKANEEH